MKIKAKTRQFLIQNPVGDSVWHVLHKANLLSRRIRSDKTFFSKAFQKNTGRKMNWENPVTFDEKQLWLKMYYRNPLCVRCSDKYAVRSYVEGKGLGAILNPLYAVFDSVDAITWETLPDRFYMKTNHGSACNIRCNGLSGFDKEAAIKKLRRSMRENYYYESREWNYRDIKRKILVEAIIEPKEPAGLIDYRFLCCNGRCEYLFVDIDTADEEGNHRHDARRNVYDREMQLMDVTVSRPRFDPKLVQKPANFDEMLRDAETLSGTFPFCRVDLYNVGGKIVFGELTFFHAGGLSHITPEEWEYRLGENIDIALAKKQIEHNYREN